MTSRVSTSLPVTSIVPSRGAKSPALPAEQPAETTPPQAPNLVQGNFAISAGPGLYRQVQQLPENEPSGQAGRTPKDPEKAKAAGVGRKIDKYA